MRDGALISPSKKNALTSYEHGVLFFIKTVDSKYEVDRNTAEKLAQLLINSDDTKFVRVQTSQGLAVINVSSIMAIQVDESKARRTLTPEQTKAWEKQKQEQDEVDTERLRRFYEKRARGNLGSNGEAA